MARALFRTFAGALFILATVCVSTASAQHNGRVALVVGNSAYDDDGPLSLSGSRSDADAVASALENMNFEVIRRLDLDWSGFDDALAEFQSRSEDASVAVFYYSGHVMHFGAKSYLMPIGAILDSRQSLEFKLISLNEDVVRKAMGLAAQKIVIIDATHNNAVADQFAMEFDPRHDPSDVRGLAPLPSTSGLVIASAVPASTVLSRGLGGRNYYSEELARALSLKGTEIRDALKRVGKNVQRETHNEQVPIYAASDDWKDFYVSPLLPDHEFWKSIKFSDDVKKFSKFIRLFPHSLYVGLATERMTILIRTANEQRMIRDQAAKEQAARDQAAREQAARDQAAKEQAARDQAAKERAARDQAAKEQAARDQAAKEQAARDQAAKEQAARDQAARDQAAKEQAARDQAAKEQAAARDQAAKEQAARDQAAKEQAAARDQAAKEQAARDQADVARDQASKAQAAAREQTAKDQATKDQAAKDQAAKDQAAKDQAAKDQAAKDQAAKDQAALAQAVKEAATRARVARERALLRQAQERAAREQAEREQVARERAARRQAVENQKAQREAARIESERRRAARRPVTASRPSAPQPRYGNARPAEVRPQKVAVERRQGPAASASAPARSSESGGCNGCGF